MNRKKMISIGLTTLITLSLVIIIFVPTAKAVRFDIQITWNLLYLTDSYDNDYNGLFEVQLKYYKTSGWNKKDSPSKSCTVLEPGLLYPGKTFTISDVVADTYIYFRLHEVDFARPNDQVVEQIEMDSGGGITDGSWVNRVWLEDDFTYINTYADNSEGDWFTLVIINLGWNRIINS